MLVDMDITMTVFMKNSHTQMSINRGRMTKIKSDHASLAEIISFPLLEKSFEGEILPFRDREDTTRG